MSAIRFRRTSDHLPAEHEVLDIAADGTFSMWRSTGEAVGRFAGRVPASSAIADAIARLGTDAPPATPVLPIDASLECLDVDDRTLSIGAHEQLNGPWGEVLGRCRSLIDSLREQPSAALRLDITDVSRPALVHVGPAALTLELIEPAATVSLWRDAQLVDSARGFADVNEQVLASSGWRLPIPVDGLTTMTGDAIVVEVGTDAYDGDRPIPVHVHATTDVT
jgi:hypothetical protein